MAAVLVLGATTWRVWRAEAAALAANEDLKKEQALTAAQRDRAESNYREARKVLDVLTRLGVEELAGRPDLQALRRRLLTELLGYYQEFIDQYSDDPEEADELIEAQLQVAEILDEVGKKAESLAAFEKAMRDRENRPGGPRPPPGGRPFRPPRGLVRPFLLSQPAVQKDLKLSAEQVAKLAPLVDLRGKPPPKESLAAVLEPAQAERLEQIVRQTRGPQALLEAETAAALGLTDKQKEALRALLAPPRREPWRHDDRGRPRPPGRRPEGESRQVNDRALQVLTPEQRGRWQAMLGEPFQGDLHFGPPRHGR
jgi:hypothetical protein